MAKVKDTFSAAFAKRTAAVKQQARASAEESAITIAEMAMEFAPEDTGELRNSVYIEENASNSNITSFTVGFDDPKALLIHEWVERPYRIGGPKFLRNALTQWEGDGKRQMVANLKQALEKGTVATTRNKRVNK